MTAQVIEAGGMTVLILPADGLLISGEADAGDVLSEAFSADADWVAVPVACLGEGFLDLKTRQAGLFIQKIVNYQRRIAFVGDISAAVANSNALRDFVRESNRGQHVWFVATLDELTAKLEEGGARP